MKEKSGEGVVKICKTCRFWSMDKKGFCDYDQRGVGQFWYCEHWLAEDGAEKAEPQDSPVRVGALPRALTQRRE